MTTGQATIIMKDPKKGITPGNYRPITCSSVIWKLITSGIANEIYKHLRSEEIIGKEHMGCRKAYRETKDHRLLDKVIIMNFKAMKTNFAMTLIDYQKAYDLVLHSWIPETVRITGVEDNVPKLLGNSMRQWKTNLQCNGHNFLT